MWIIPARSARLTRRRHRIESIASVFVRTDRTASLSPPIAIDERNVARESMADSFLGCPGLLLRAIRFISAERDIIAAGSRHMANGARSAHEARIVAMLDLVDDFDCYKSPFTRKMKGHLLRKDCEKHNAAVCCPRCTKLAPWSMGNGCSLHSLEQKQLSMNTSLNCSNYSIRCETIESC